MKTDKTIFIIPGNTHSPSDKAYKKITEIFEKKGFFVIPIFIPWDNTVVSENVELFLKEYNKIKSKNKYVLGFSFGAIIAFIASTRVNFKAQVLCSLSPYFSEDLPFIKQDWIEGIGEKKLNDFRKISNHKLVKEVKSPTTILYGTKEGEFIIHRCEDTYERLQVKKKLLKIDGAKHDIGNNKYIKQLEHIEEIFKYE